MVHCHRTRWESNQLSRDYRSCRRPYYPRGKPAPNPGRWRSFRTAHHPAQAVGVRPHLAMLLLSGAALGFLSGLTGVGGGIFLSPLLLLFRWAEVKVISGIAAAFILVNSIAGLLGVVTSAPELPSALPFWAVAATVGGFVGAEYGSKRLANPAIQKLLAVVLVIAGAKMIATA